MKFNSSAPWVATAALVASNVISCSSEEPRALVVEEPRWVASGSIRLGLTLGGSDITTVTAVISGNNGFATQSHTIDVAGDAGVASIFFGELPAQRGYHLRLTAGACTGSADFSVEAGQTTWVPISMQCPGSDGEGDRGGKGSAQITGTIVPGREPGCNLVTNMVAAPSMQNGDGPPSTVEVVLNSGVSASSILWTQSSANNGLGVISGSSGASDGTVTFDCTRKGSVALTASVTASGSRRSCTEQAGVTIECNNPPELAYPWGSSSTHIAIRRFDFWDGSSRFEADRSELTAAQLAVLDGLRQIPTPTSGLAADSVSYTIAISDSGGDSVTYRAAQQNLRDSDEPELARPTIDVNTLAPFLASFHCLTAAQTRAAPPVGFTPQFVGDERLPVNWSDAPAVSTSTPGCFHGIFAPYLCSDIWLRLQVDVPGAYLLSASKCFEQLAISVLSSDGSRELASASGVRDACPALSYVFAQAGNYPLVLHKSNIDGCSAEGAAGDFYLRVRTSTVP